MTRAVAPKKKKSDPKSKECKLCSIPTYAKSEICAVCEVKGLGISK